DTASPCAPAVGYSNPPPSVFRYYGTSGGMWRTGAGAGNAVARGGRRVVGWGGMQGDSALGKNYPWRRASIWVGAALVLAVRGVPAPVSAPQFWAEDASAFVHQADHLGGQALNLPHAGYHHLVMRLWAGFWVGIGAPVVAMPALFVFGATLGWLAVG